MSARPLYVLGMLAFAVLLGALIVHLYTAQESIEQQPTTEEVWLDVGEQDEFVPTCPHCGEVARDLQENGQ